MTNMTGFIISNDYTVLLWPCLMAFFATYFALNMLQPLAIHLQLVDNPNSRKNHTGQIPLIGGIAMFFGFALSLLTVNMSLYPYRSFLASTVILLFIGVLDDFNELNVRTRFLIQIFVGCLITIWGRVILENLGNLLFLGNIHLAWLAIPFTVFAVIGVINSVNMIDGVDGLAGTTSFFQLVFLLFLAYHTGHHPDTVMLALQLAALAAFLVCNFPVPWRQQAKVFMGDAGSMYIGFVLAWFAISLSQGTHSVDPVVMLWVMGLPLFDTITVMLRRALNHKSLFKADRTHLHHLLQKKEFKTWQITIIMSAISFMLGLIGVIGYLENIQAGYLFLMLCVVYICYFLATHLLNRKLDETIITATN